MLLIAQNLNPTILTMCMIFIFIIRFQFTCRLVENVHLSESTPTFQCKPLSWHCTINRVSCTNIIIFVFFIIRLKYNYSATCKSKGCHHHKNNKHLNTVNVIFCIQSWIVSTDNPTSHEYRVTLGDIRVSRKAEHWHPCTSLMLTCLI